MSVRTELEKATGLKARKNEEPAKFRLRLIEAVSALDEEDYDEISEEAKKWSNDAIDAYGVARKLKAIPDFPGEEAHLGEEPEPGIDEPGVDLDEEVSEEEVEPSEEEPEDGEQEEEDEMTHTDVNESTSRRKSRAKPAPKAAKKAAKNAKPAPKARPSRAKPAAEEKQGQGLDYARKLLAKNIKLTASDLRAKVRDAGYEVSNSTLSTGASGFRAAVKALQAAGKLKTDMLN